MDHLSVPREYGMIAGVPSDSQVYLNGCFTRVGDAKISVLDRGFIFGDGIYEVVPIYNGRAFRMEEHLGRLERSLAAVRIAPPFDRAGWVDLIGQLVARAHSPTCFVYLQITRGVARRDHPYPSPAPTPTVFGMTTAFTPPSPEECAQGLSAICVPDERWLHCEIKSVSLLGNVMAKQRAVDAGVDEVIQFRDGKLTEGASSNIWVAVGGTLFMPPKNNLILEGIRYGLITELAAEQGIVTQVRALSQAEVGQADEIMMSSATKEILPILTLDGKPVGQGVPGPVYTLLRAAYDARLAEL